MIGAFVRGTVSGALVFATAWFWLSVNFDRAVFLLFLQPWPKSHQLSTYVAVLQFAMNLLEYALLLF